MDCLVGQEGQGGLCPGQTSVSMNGIRLSQEHFQAPQKQTSCKREKNAFQVSKAFTEPPF